MNHIKLMALLAALMLFQGCVSMAQYTPMTKDNKDKIETLYVYNLIIQDEIRPAVELSNVTGALGGGLIGAMIDSSVNDGRATDARAMLDDFYTASLDFDYRQLHNSEFAPFLSSQFAIAAEGVVVSSVVLTEKEIEQRVAKLAPNEGFLFLSSHYTFVESFKMLQTSVSAFLFVGGNAKPKVSKPDFHNSYVYQSPVVGSGGGESIALWTENKADLFREQMKNSIAHSVKSMHYEMQPTVAESCATSVTFTLPTQLNTQKISGVVVEQTDQGTLVRGKTGQLYLVDKSRLTTKPNNKCSQEVATNA